LTARPLNPHWTPIRRAKSRVVCTMRASISTCGSGRSSVVISSVARVIRSARSVMISVFVRTSVVIDPRWDSTAAVSSGCTWSARA
jgi:hypothetical protein